MFWEEGWWKANASNITFWGLYIVGWNGKLWVLSCRIFYLVWSMPFSAQQSISWCLRNSVARKNQSYKNSGCRFRMQCSSHGSAFSCKECVKYACCHTTARKNIRALLLGQHWNLLTLTWSKLVSVFARYLDSLINEKNVIWHPCEFLKKVLI